VQDENLSQEDFAQYFPSFLWVVRDFTLKLINEDGDRITSKEYLEGALRLQPGYSDDVEQKNRIRRLLFTFFQSRDCVTLIRPILDEHNLQNLMSLPESALRPEFVEQA